MKYKAKLFPIGPIIALALCTIVILGQGITYFQADSIDWSGVISSYIGLPLFLALWIGYKRKHNTKVIDLMDVDFDNLEENEYESEDIA